MTEETELPRPADEAPVKLWLTDAKGRCTFVNRAWWVYVGMPMKSQLGQGWLAAFHPNDLEPAQAALKAARSSPASFVRTYRLRRHDGSYRWHRESVGPRYDDQGNFDGHMGSAVEVHDEVEEEHHLRRKILESEAKLRACFEQSQILMAVLGPDGQIEELNGAALELAGEPLAALRGQSFWETAWWRGRKALQAQVREALYEARTTRKTVRLALDFQHPEGHLGRLDLSVAPVCGPDGALMALLATGLDITESHRIALALAQSEQRYRLHSETSPHIVWTARPDGNIDYVNQTAVDYSGETAENLVREGWTRFIHPEDLPGSLALWVECLQTGKAVHAEYRMRRHDGVYRWHRVDARPVRDETGAVVQWVGTNVDIDDVKRAEALLQESEQRYRIQSETSPHLVWTATPDGAIDYVNQTTVDYLGVPAEQILAQGWADFLHPEDRASTFEHWGHSVATGERLNIEYRLRRHDGVYRWNRVEARPLRDAEGRIHQWIGGNADIEDLKRAEAAAAEAARVKAEFLANMSHEIRTPMNGVIGMTTLLAETVLTPSQREYVETIRTSGEHLLTVINDVLDFSKADAGKLDLEHYSFPLRGCIEEAADLVAQGAARKGLELVIDAPPDLPPRVSGDAGRLRQILVNLLGNAVKFTERGEVVLSVRISRLARGDAPWRIAFAVIDTGIGIPAHRMDRLFQMFSQVDASQTRTYGGTGLGLAICKKLVERMDGWISAESVEGQGSVFRFEVALGAAEDAREAERKAHPLRGRRALIVDDNATNLRVLRAMLESWGMAVVAVDEPMAALRLAQEQPFDVALIDLMMPDFSGLDLARTLRDLRPSAGLPLILLGSVGPGEDIRESGLFVARLMKPVRQSTLHDQLAQLFDPQPSAREAVGPTGEMPSSASRPLRVLVAEDNAVNQKVAQQFLKRLGHHADLATDGREAVEAVCRQPYDVVLMDVQMPELDGYSATREIRARAYHQPYIVAVTANALAGDEQRCREAGMDDYLSKPLNARALAKALERAALTRPSRAEPEPETPPLPEDDTAEGLSQLIATFEAEGAAELVRALADDLPAQAAALEAAFAQGDARFAARVAHTLKSNARLVGASALGECCEALEHAWRDGTLPPALPTDAAEMLARYRALVERLCAELPR